MVFGWGKKKQEKSSVENITQSKEILLSNIPKIISDLSELRQSQTMTEINDLRNYTEPLIDDLMKIGNLLEKDSLNIDDIDKHLAIIVVRGKKQVIDVIKKGVVSLPKISSLDDAKKLDSVLNIILKKVGDVLGRQTRVIHIFAKKYATQLKDNLEVMNKNHSEITKLLKNLNSTKSLSDEINASLNQITNLTNLHKENSQKIIEINKHVNSLQEKISLTQNSIDKIHLSDSYKKYLDLKNTLNIFSSQKLKIKNEINTQFTKISRPLSRYEYASSLDKDQKKILSKLVAEPFDVLIAGEKDSIIMILENVRKGIASGSISVKDVNKTSLQITETEESLDKFVKQISEYNKRYDQMKSDLNSLISDDLISLESDLAKTITLKGESESKSKSCQDEMREIDLKIPEITSGIEGKLRKFSNTQYKIIKS